MYVGSHSFHKMEDAISHCRLYNCKLVKITVLTDVFISFSVCFKMYILQVLQQWLCFFKM